MIQKSIIIIINIIFIVITYYLLQLSFHSVAVVLTLVQTKQLRMNIHERNSEEHSTNNTKLSKYKYIHYQNTHTHTYTYPHVTKQVKTTTLNNLSNYMAQSISESHSGSQKFLRIIEIPFTQEPATGPSSETHQYNTQSHSISGVAS